MCFTLHRPHTPPDRRWSPGDGVHERCSATPCSWLGLLSSRSRIQKPGPSWRLFCLRPGMSWQSISASPNAVRWISCRQRRRAWLPSARPRTAGCRAGPSNPTWMSRSLKSSGNTRNRSSKSGKLTATSRRKSKQQPLPRVETNPGKTDGAKPATFAPKPIARFAHLPERTLAQLPGIEFDYSVCRKILIYQNVCANIEAYLLTGLQKPGKVW